MLRQMSRRSARLSRSSVDGMTAVDENTSAVANQKPDEVQRLSLASKRSTRSSSMELASKPGIILDDIENKFP